MMVPHEIYIYVTDPTWFHNGWKVYKVKRLCICFRDNTAFVWQLLYSGHLEVYKVQMHNFGKGPPKDFLNEILFHSIQWFWERFSKISNFHSVRNLGGHLEWWARSLDTIFIVIVISTKKLPLLLNHWIQKYHDIWWWKSWHGTVTKKLWG